MHNSDILLDFPKENRIIYDWLSFTTKKHTVVELIDLLGLRGCPFETVSGSKGYQWREYYNGISIHFNEKDFQIASQEFIWLEMSGQGCRAFESYGNGDYCALFTLAREDPANVHITRLDVAFDDMTGVFDIIKICDDVRNENFVSRLSKYQSIYSNAGNAVYFGSKKSNVFIRIYDKAAERGYNDPSLHWIRCELQLKDTNARGFIDKLQRSSLNELYLGVLKNYISFRVPTNDSNKRRWPVQEWWDSFLDDAVAISVWSRPGVEYNLSACERYVMTQPVGSIRTLIQIYGKDAFLDMIKNAPPSKNPKYDRLIKQAEMATKFDSDYATLDRWIELSEPHEIDILAEIHEGYREIHCESLKKRDKALNVIEYQERLKNLHKLNLPEAEFKLRRDRLRKRLNIE